MFSSQYKKRKTMQRGFTLIELMVSLSIFAIVMTISVSTLLVLIDVNAKAQAINSGSTNLSFALDSMTREIRTGFHYFCYTGGTAPGGSDQDIEVDETQDCENGNALIFTREWDRTQLRYRFVVYGDRGAIQFREIVLAEDPNGPPESDTGWQDITSEDVDIDTFKLRVEGSTTNSNGGDTVQPTVDVMITGHVTNGLDEETDFRIQTHIVQRLLDRV